MIKKKTDGKSISYLLISDLANNWNLFDATNSWQLRFQEQQYFLEIFEFGLTF